MKKEKKFNAHYVRIKKYRHDYFSAYVTWGGIDIAEIGETEKSAANLLFTKHTKFLGITHDQIPSLMASIGL